MSCLSFPGAAKEEAEEEWRRSQPCVHGRLHFLLPDPTNIRLRKEVTSNPFGNTTKRTVSTPSQEGKDTS